MTVVGYLIGSLEWNATFANLGLQFTVIMAID